MKTVLFCFVALLTLGSCGNNPDTKLIDGEVVGSDVAKHEAVTQARTASTSAYLDLQEALVASDLPSAQRAAGKLAVAMGEARVTWMTTAPTLGAAARQVESASSIEGVREAFSDMTAALVAAVKRLGDGGRELYVQHCPMACDNAESDWVSGERDVRNPYFGDAMLRCAKVTEEL